VSEVPSLSLAQAILRTIAQHTGRPVNGVEVYAFRQDYIQVTVALGDDGTIDVSFADPMAPGPVVGGIA
jgi:hypothetical protein